MNKFWAFFCSALLGLSSWQGIAQTTTPIVLQIVKQNLKINDRVISTFNIVNRDGSWGIVGTKGQIFDFVIQNKTNEATALHWHGLTVPNDQDGTPFISQNPIGPGQEMRGKIQLMQAGTFWVRSAYKSQLQNLMAAPVIITDPKADNIQNVVMMLQDVSFQDPKISYPQLRDKLMQKMADIQLSESGTMASNQTSQVTMDAYLTNRRTLADPEIARVNPNTAVYLRIINGSANTNFLIDLGQLSGKLVAVDSEPVSPLENSKFQIAQGQRLDIIVNIPGGDGYYPILAQAENTTRLTGLILATQGMTPPLFNPESSQPPSSLDDSQEQNLHALNPLKPQSMVQSYQLDLSNNMLSYLWMIDHQVWPNVNALKVQNGERVELLLNNKTDMGIPIHLHGHTFQIIAINGQAINGAKRDTVFVLPHSTITIAFDANNPGIWLLEGFIPYLSYGRMATTINYQDFPIPIFKQKDTGNVPTATP